MPETSSQPGASSLEQILWRAMDRFREEPALLDAEEFADHIAHAFETDLCEERFSDRFFDGGDRMHAQRPTLAEALAGSRKQPLHAYEFDLDHLEYVIVEDRDRLVVVSSFGQFQVQNDDAVGRALEAAVVKAVGRPGAQPRGYFVRAGGEVVGIDVDRIARTLERLMVRQVSLPAVEAPAARLAPFNPIRKALSESREQLALRQEPRLARPAAAAPAPPPARQRDTPERRETALFVVMPDGSLARAEIGSATRWERMLGHYARTAAQQVAVDAGNVLAIVRATRPDGTGERARMRAEALATVRETSAPVRVLAGDDLARALAEGGHVVPAAGQRDRFWIQPEQAFRPELPLPARTAVAEPVQLGEITGDPWADWALAVGGALARRRGVAAAGGENAVAAVARRVRATRSAPVQIAGGPVVAFRAPDGSIIVNRDAGPIRLAAVGRGEADDVPAAPIAIRNESELVPRAGAIPSSALQTLQFALERTAAAGAYRLPAVNLDARPDAIDGGKAVPAGPFDPRRRSVRLAGPVIIAERIARLVVSIPFPNRGELHVGDDLTEALHAFIAGPVLPPRRLLLIPDIPRSGTTAAHPAPPSLHADGSEWTTLHEHATHAADAGLATLDAPAVRSLAIADPAISDLPLLLRHAVAQSGDWVPGPGAPLPLAVRDFAFRAPFVAAVDAAPQVMQPPRAPSPGEEEIIIPLPLWAQMGRGAISETAHVLAAPSMPRGHASPVGAYRLVVPGAGPIDLTAGAPAGAANAVEIAGPMGLRLEAIASGGGRAAAAGGRHFLGRVPLDEAPLSAPGRPRFRVGPPVQVAAGARPPDAGAPQVLAVPAETPDSRPPPAAELESTAKESAAQALSPRAADFNRPGPPPSLMRPPGGRAALSQAAFVSASPALTSEKVGSRAFDSAREMAGMHRRAAAPALRTVTGSPRPAYLPPTQTFANVDRRWTPSTSPTTWAAPPETSGDVPVGLEPGMWSGHRPATTDRYRRWTYSSWNLDSPQVVGDVPLSGLSRRQYPELPVALRFRYAGAPLWWAHTSTGDDASARAVRAMQAGVRAANTAAAIWQSILVASAPAGDVLSGMDRGRDTFAERMTSLARSFDAMSAPAAAPRAAAARGVAPAYIAVSSTGAAGAVTPASAAAGRSRAQSVEMSIVAAVPPSPPPLESMSSATRGVDVPRARGKGHAQDAAHGHHKEADDAVSHSKIEGSVDAIAQRIYHRIRRRIESDRERFGG